MVLVRVDRVVVGSYVVVVVDPPGPRRLPHPLGLAMVAVVATGWIVKNLKNFLLKTQEKLNNDVMFSKLQQHN